MAGMSSWGWILVRDCTWDSVKGFDMKAIEHMTMITFILCNKMCCENFTHERIDYTKCILCVMVTYQANADRNGWPPYTDMMCIYIYMNVQICIMMSIRLLEKKSTIMHIWTSQTTRQPSCIAPMWPTIKFPNKLPSEPALQYDLGQHEVTDKFRNMDKCNFAC